MNLLPRTIARKLVFYLGLTNCLVLGATVWFSYGRARTMLVEQIDATALQQVRTAAIRLDDFLAKAAIRAEMIASRQNARLASASPTATNSMEMPSEFDPGLMPLLVRMLKDAPLDEAYGVWICRVPTEGQTVHDGDLLATHRHTWPKRTVFEPDYLATIPDQEWFSGTQKTGKPCITEPYYDEGGGNASMVSLSHPCFDERNRLVAVSGVDVELARIYHIISELQEAVTREKGVGYAFLVSAAGRIITHPEVKFMLGKNNPGARITDLAEGSLVANRPNGSCVAHLAGEDRRLYWSTAPVANWKIVFNMSNLVITRRVGNLATTIGLLGLGGVLLSSVVLVIIAGGISRPLVRLTAIAQKVAAGDLHGAKLGLSSFDKSNQAGVRSPADETGQLLAAIQTMTNSLSNLIGQVQRAGVQITSTAQQIAATAREQEKTVNTFGSSTSEISASVREISATNQELLNTMNSVSAVATQTASLAESGRQLLHTRQEAMDQMRTATGSISGKLSVMNQRAGDINMVITTITKVADQTNLLSLNAAIEAEKAGEAGLGFSVVAREIRRLADQTAAATLDIERMVKEMQSSVSSGVMEMDKFSQGVSRDVEEMATLTTRLEQIIQQVQGLTSRFEEVNVGMRAQSEGAEQISAAMTHLNDGARQTAASLNEFNQATRNLDTAVAGLRDHISRFKVNG